MRKPRPDVLTGRKVLDLGCGAGIDVFIAAQLVGETGEVIGVDMTDEQLAIAERNIDPIMKNIGFKKPNVRFVKGMIEEIPVESGSVDVVISNCVVNLSEAKDRVFSEIHRVLKPGGEFLIADIVADRRIPERLAEDTRLYSECLTGAAYKGDLRRLMEQAGFNDVRTLDVRQLGDVIEGIHFESMTLRGFKIDLEDACETTAKSRSTKARSPEKTARFELDGGHLFEAGIPMRICKNTADMITKTRYATHFDVSAEMFHMGLFDCAPTAGAATADGSAGGAVGCC